MTRYQELTKFIIILAMSLCLVALYVPQAFSEGSIGASYSQVADDVRYGGTATYQRAIGDIDLELSSQVQSGDRYLADAHAALTFKAGGIGFRPYVDATGKADVIDLDDLGTLGGKLDYGLTLNIPVEEGSEIGVGVFLRNANPFAEKVLYEMVDGEYMPVESNSGINYDNPSKVNILAYTGLEVLGLDIGLKGSMGVGERDYWLIVDAAKSLDIGIAEISVGLNYGNRWYNDMDDMEVRETDIAVITTLSKSW